MNLRLQQLRLPLSDFTLEVDMDLTSPATAIFGPSGAGKTSLLELIAGLRRPVSGRIILGDVVLTDVAAHTRVPVPERGIGYVPQDLALFPHLNTRENLTYGIARGAGAGPAFGFDHVVECLELGALLDRNVGTLSGGERQRVALGRALVSGPRLLLLDEPLASLDAALKAQVLPLLQRVKAEFQVPLVYVTHDATEVRRLCDEVIHLTRGQVQARSSAAEFLKQAD